MDLSELIFDPDSFGYAEIKSFARRSDRGMTLTFEADVLQYKLLKSRIQHFTRKHEWDIPVERTSQKFVTITNGGPIYDRASDDNGDRRPDGTVHHNRNRKKSST